MDGVDPVQRGNAFGCDACVLNPRHELSPLRRGIRMASAVQHAAHPTCVEGRTQFVAVQCMGLVEDDVDVFFLAQFSHAQHVQRELGHLPHLVLKRHACKHRLHFGRPPERLQRRIRHALRRGGHVTRFHQHQASSKHHSQEPPTTGGLKCRNQRLEIKAHEQGGSGWKSSGAGRFRGSHCSLMARCLPRRTQSTSTL